MTDSIFLLSTTYQKNEYGVSKPVNVKKETFCEVKSISRSEFYQAGTQGLKPSYVFLVFKGDYSGETVIEYNGATYSVYRTYATDNDYLELYVERKVGTNGAQSNN